MCIPVHVYTSALPPTFVYLCPLHFPTALLEAGQSSDKIAHNAVRGMGHALVAYVHGGQTEPGQTSQTSHGQTWSNQTAEHQPAWAIQGLEFIVCSIETGRDRVCRTCVCMCVCVQRTTVCTTPHMHNTPSHQHTNRKQQSAVELLLCTGFVVCTATSMEVLLVCRAHTWPGRTGGAAAGTEHTTQSHRTCCGCASTCP